MENYFRHPAIEQILKTCLIYFAFFCFFVAIFLVKDILVQAGVICDTIDVLLTCCLELSLSLYWIFVYYMSSNRNSSYFGFVGMQVLGIIALCLVPFLSVTFVNALPTIVPRNVITYVNAALVMYMLSRCCFKWFLVETIIDETY